MTKVEFFSSYHEKKNEMFVKISLFMKATMKRENLNATRYVILSHEFGKIIYS